MSVNTRTQPYQWGDAHPVETKAVPSANVINIGDLVGLDGSNQPFAAAGEAWNTDLPTTQAAFVTNFLGVSRDRSRSGDVDTIVVNTGGVHLFKCASASWEVGALVGPAKDTGNALLSDTVVSVADEAHAIGRVARREGSNVTEVFVEVFGNLTKGRTA